MTILTEIEGVLNLRPLTYSCEELGEPLTPAHLIIGRRILDKPTPLSFESHRFRCRYCDETSKSFTECS